MGKLDGKVGLITGAASGIGRATSLEFAREGAKVALVDLAQSGLDSLVGEIKSGGGEALAITADVSVAADARRMVDEAVRRFGRLDIIFNNAGIGYPGQLLHEIEESEWDRVLAVNLRGVFLGCKYVLPQMMKQGGIVLNTSSIAGIEGSNVFAHYSASKGAIVTLTKSIAIDYARFNIRANCICPARVDTPRIGRILDMVPEEKRAQVRRASESMHLLNRYAEPREIARVAVFLCSDDSSYMTGQAVIVDGGLTAGHSMQSRLD
jgi:meso-butanediol dehydrogenase / (S,S)-butanediol dehydrogenase / diacetyl reductase